MRRQRPEPTPRGEAQHSPFTTTPWILLDFGSDPAEIVWADPDERPEPESEPEPERAPEPPPVRRWQNEYLGHPTAVERRARRLCEYVGVRWSAPWHTSIADVIRRHRQEVLDFTRLVTLQGVLNNPTRYDRYVVDRRSDRLILVERNRNRGRRLAQQVAQWRTIRAAGRATSPVTGLSFPLTPELALHHAMTMLADFTGWELSHTPYNTYNCGTIQGIVEREFRGYVSLCPDCGGLRQAVTALCENCRRRQRQNARRRRGSGCLNGYQESAESLIPLESIGQHGVADWIRLGFELELEYSFDDYDDDQWDEDSYSRAGRAAWDVVASISSVLPDGSVEPEHDGSLNDGAEFVFTHGTLKTWQHYLGRLQDEHPYVFSDAGFEPRSSCGLHIHMSPVPSPRTFARMSRLMNHANHEQFLRRILGRSWNSYASKRPVEHLDASSATELIGNRFQSDRYHCLSITDRGTVELRLPASTDSWQDVRAMLEFADALHRWARRTSFPSCTPASLAAYVAARQTRYSALADVMKAHGYITDAPTPATAEGDLTLCA